ncbi:uncharacterized protein LOC143301451 isoform X2 [Babylonia areolata]|uniref:uncharacterized protein LOC143301451 isoform X2 n=1 Tax=Babylonia areolata TaxID=304850 RepID=UPI003FD5C73D
MMNLKTLGAFAVIVGCFAVVYPRFLHPFVLRAFGMNPASTKEEDSHYPPHMRNGKPLPADRRPPPMPHDPKDIRQHMRPGPHPGMRAAAEMQKQQAGTGRGMMGIVLPMYAIGICVYLVYTLFKVFNKRGKYPDPYTKRESEDGSGVRMDRMGFPKRMQGFEGEQECDEGEVQRFLRQKQQEPEDEMRALQKRLEETEAQMTRILQAMQSMQSRVGTMNMAGVGGEEQGAVDGTEDRAPSGTAETVGTTAPTASSSEESQRESHEALSRTSSPDSESYEIVKNSASVTNDISPDSELSSRSSFEQISKAGEVDPAAPAREEMEEDGKCEGLVPGQQDKEESSSVRHRKTAHPEED